MEECEKYTLSGPALDLNSSQVPLQANLSSEPFADGYAGMLGQCRRDLADALFTREMFDRSRNRAMRRNGRNALPQSEAPDGPCTFLDQVIHDIKRLPLVRDYDQFVVKNKQRHLTMIRLAEDDARFGRITLDKKQVVCFESWNIVDEFCTVR